MRVLLYLLLGYVYAITFLLQESRRISWFSRTRFHGRKRNFDGLFNGLLSHRIANQYAEFETMPHLKWIAPCSARVAFVRKQQKGFLYCGSIWVMSRAMCGQKGVDQHAHPSFRLSSTVYAFVCGLIAIRVSEIGRWSGQTKTTAFFVYVSVGGIFISIKLSFSSLYVLIQ